MKEYVSPKAEFVEFTENDVMATSECLEDGLCLDYSCSYVCPNSYGQICTGQTYSGC